MPKEIVEFGDYYEFLKLEQPREHLHAVLNKLERQLAAVKKVAERYFLMLKFFLNKVKIDKTLFIFHKLTS